MAHDATARRKDEHLDLCADGDVEPASNRTLLDCVRLLHCALPELSLTEVDTTVTFMGRRLSYPILITGMTGGTERAGLVNRDLATVAERRRVAFGVGSQRAMAEDPARAESFKVRDVAPSTVVLGNVGLWQAAILGPDRVLRLRDDIGADGLALHLNVAQELTQPEGDRDFRGGYATVEAMVRAFGDRLVVKETGCGISPAVARRLASMGVRCLDVSGAGGTSWVRVEQLRAQGTLAQIGADFSGWGIPTAAAIASVRRAVGPEVTLIASGGVRHGLDAAAAVALGADLVGLALPLFRGQQRAGMAGADAALEVVLEGYARALVLTGSRHAAELRERPRVVTGELREWLAGLL